MAFDETPEGAETGTFEDSLANENETVEVWIEHDGQHYGFQLLPKENIPWSRKSEAVEEAIGPDGFSTLDYYRNMLKYQIQETSFGAEERLDMWIMGVSSGLLEQLEPHVPDPEGDIGRDEQAGVVLDYLDDYLSSEGDPDASVEAFRAWVKGQSEDEEGK